MFEIDGTQESRIRCDLEEVVRMDNCLVHNLTNTFDCLECDSNFYFNPTVQTCDLCETLIPGCEHCSGDGSVCETCYRNYDIQEDATCKLTYCIDYDQENDLCNECKDGFALKDNEGVFECVNDCGEGLFTDLHNKVCRTECAENEAYNSEDPTVCLPCAEATGVEFCESCSPEEGIIGNTYECNQCLLPMMLIEEE